MYISINWLKDFVELPKNLDPLRLAETLTLKTAEVEGVENQAKGLDGVVVGEILEIRKHPNADKLNLAKVDIGRKEPLNLIFGQMVQMKIGNKIPVAIAPTTLPTGITIEKKKLRGEPSEGMLCLDQELGLEKEGDSIQYFPNLKPGTPIAEALNLTDVILEFDNKALTHRPDLWGHTGIAREIAAITNSTFKPLKPAVKIPTKGESVKVIVEDKTLCPRYCGLIISNVKIGQSPDWLKTKLRATKHGTHNNIVDVTNYVMAELGQPLHAFDKNYIKGGIIVRRAKHNEKITTLDDKIRTLTEDMLVIADHKKPVAVAGVIGGQNSEINEKTTSIILEAANFNSSSIRRTSTRLGLRTEAVQRFEKALDPLLPELAIKRAAELILKICPGAKVAGPITDVKKFNTKPVTVKLDTQKATSKIGVDISPKQIKEILESLEFKVKPVISTVRPTGKKSADKTSGQIFEVTIPTFRATKDIEIEDDLIEEIARLYGYDNIPTTLPTLPTKLPEENIERFKKHRAREVLSYGLGLNEVYNYSFYGQTELNNCLLKEAGHVKLLNYLSEDQTHLRISLVPNILKNLQENIKYFDDVKIYEIGRSYKDIGKYYPLEEKKITGAILNAPSGKTASNSPFHEAKGITETLLKKFNITNFKVTREVEKPYAHPVKSISYLTHDAQTLAEVFMLHPTVAKNHDLQNYSIAFFDINFSQLNKLKIDERKYKRIPRFPDIKIDISVVIDRTVEIAKILSAIKNSDQNLISEVDLFDIYEGENIEKGKKATAFNITLRAPDRTLTDAEMSQVQQKIFSNLEKMGGKIRGK